MWWSLVVCLYFIAICYQEASGLDLTVSPECSDDNCKLMNESLEELTSDSTLFLTAGEHQLNYHIPITDLQNVSIIGEGSDVVNITCVNEVGLSFVNISDLTLSGFTIIGCGLSGVNLNSTILHLREMVSLHFLVPTVVEFGLVLGACVNVDLEDMVITGTTGIGLFGLNVMGTSVLSQVTFSNNTCRSCERPPSFVYPYELGQDLYDRVGGGAYFLYQDYTKEYEDKGNQQKNMLTVVDANFTRNADCGFSAMIETNYQLFSSVSGNNSVVGAGGGLSVLMAQHSYNANVSTENSTFYKNDARFGGGAHVGMFVGVELSHVVFRDCIFEQNGFFENTSIAVAGAGLAVFTDLLYPGNINNPFSIPEHDVTVHVEIIDSIFLRNRARVQGGGVLVYSLFNTPHRQPVINDPGFYTTYIFIENCNFSMNIAQFGAALYLYQYAIDGWKGNIKGVFTNVTVDQSSAHENLDSTVFGRQTSQIISAVALYNVFVSFRDHVSISNNNITGLLIHSSPVFIMPDTHFLIEDNSGQLGGGLYIEGQGSVISMTNDSVYQLNRNRASILGGAIYLSSSIFDSDVLRGPVDYFAGCFISPIPERPCSSLGCFDIQSSTFRIQFKNNTSPLGSVIYGSAFDRCSWLQNELARNNVSSPPEELSDLLGVFANIRQLDTDLEAITPSTLTTPPGGLLAIPLDRSGATVADEVKEVFPGESIRVNVTVLDRFGQRIQGPTTAQLLDNTAQASVSLGPGGVFFSDPNTTTVTRLQVNGSANQTFNIHITELSTLVNDYFAVSLQDCPDGFTFDPNTNACVCLPNLLRKGIECNVEDLIMISPDGVWLGPLQDGDLVVASCVLDYCAEGDKSFRSPNYNDQCHNGSHRKGVLCGGCEQNHSAMLGTTTECSVCSDIYLLLIPLFAVLGIILFALVAFFQVTLDNGWTYSVLFYSNVITLTPFFLPPSNELNLLYVPAHLLSLELGFGVCLYDGMTALERTLLRFIFPLYLLILMLFFTLLSKKISFPACFSPVKTLVTLFIMSYSSVVDTCIEAFSPAPLFTVTGNEYSLHWRIDSNVLFARGLHGVLFVISLLVILIYGTVPLVLLSPQFTYKYLKRFIPIFDALYTPFKKKYRCWLAIRLFILTVLFVGSSFFSRMIGNLVCSIILLVLLEIQLILRPFEQEWVNILDSVLIGSIVTFLMGNLFFTADPSEPARTLYFIGLISFGYITIAVVFIWHFGRLVNDKIAPFVKRFKKSETVTTSEVSLSTATPAADEWEIVDYRRGNPTHTSFRGVSVRFSREPSRPRLRESLLGEL